MLFTTARALIVQLHILANPAEISKLEDENMRTPLNNQSPHEISDRIHITILIGESSQLPTHWELEELESKSPNSNRA